MNRLDVLGAGMVMLVLLLGGFAVGIELGRMIGSGEGFIERDAQVNLPSVSEITHMAEVCQQWK